jgi:hypothetical protein
MTAKLTFYPIGNADCCLIDLADGKKVLLDFADVRNPDDPYDKRIDLPDAIRRNLEEAGRDNLEVVGFTHLDEDHVKGSSEFFEFRHASKYSGAGRIKIDELWVPAGAVTEEGPTGCARVIRQEARHRLRDGKGIKVFSRPDRLRELLGSWGLTVEERRSCIVNAGETVPTFSKAGSEHAEFFVHSPFGWRMNEREVEDRNQDSIVMQATFVEDGVETYALLGADADHETLSKIVQTTRLHGREGRLLWDVLKLFHHCSYLSLSAERGVDETAAIPDVKWLFEKQGRDGCLIMSPSWPIPSKGTQEDQDVQPPHRQAANHHRRIVSKRGGEFKVTMETPSVLRPKPLLVQITRFGASFLLALPTAVGLATSTSARAG